MNKIERKIKQQKEDLLQEFGIEQEGMLNEIVYIETKRPNGTIRRQQDFQFCPTMTEQHSAHLTDINYLMERYQPDELAAYIAAKNAHRSEIIGHDFSIEPSLQDAKNFVANLRRNFELLPEEIKKNFKNHVEFVKFIDNPANQEKMIKLGLMTKKEIEANTTNTTTTNDSEAKEKKESSSQSS